MTLSQNDYRNVKKSLTKQVKYGNILAHKGVFLYEGLFKIYKK